MRKIYVISLVLMPLVMAGRWDVDETAPSEESEWSELKQLSSLEGEATRASMMADEFGYVHAVWAEDGFFDHDRSVIQYARFNGEDWTDPVTVYATWPKSLITQLSSSVDKQGTLHLVWAEGISGPLFYSSVAMADAFSAETWRDPITIDVDAFVPKMVVDSNGVVHVLYSDFYGEQPGIYYTRTENRGKWWSYPERIDPDIPPDGAPRWLNFKVDKSDGLHAVWAYVDQASAGTGRWVRYARSFDHGVTWSSPFTVDVEDEEEGELRIAGPLLAINDRIVHILWAGTEKTEREYLSSDDAGTNWTETIRVFGELHGAAGDDMSVDAAGRVHFVGQIRFPMAIYHAIWEGGQWSEPTIAYFIKENPDDEAEGRIGAHSLSLAIRSGNQLVMTFTTSPADTQSILFAMHRTPEEIPAHELALASASTPVPEATSTLTVPTPPPTDQARLPFSTNADVPRASPGNPLLLGLLPVVALIGGVFVVQAIRRR